MQKTADISKIWKIVSRDHMFIFHVILGSASHFWFGFVWFLVLSHFCLTFPRLQKMLLVLHKMAFLENEAT